MSVSDLDLGDLYCEVGQWIDDSLCVSVGLAALNREDATKLRDWLTQALDDPSSPRAAAETTTALCMHRWTRLGVFEPFTPDPDDPCDLCGRPYSELNR